MPDWMSINLLITFAAMLACVSLVWFAGRKSGEPYNEERPNRLPWRFIMILSAFLGAMCLVHMINLFGYETGAGKGLLGRR